MEFQNLLAVATMVKYLPAELFRMNVLFSLTLNQSYLR